MMFFNLYYSPSYIIPHLFPSMPPPMQFAVQKPEQGFDFKKEEFLDLTKEDHLKAGYDKIKKPWSEEEDEKLQELRDQKDYEWEQIAKVLPNRNAKMCYSRYKRLEYRPREHWKPQQDELLKNLVEQKGQNWQFISEKFKSINLNYTDRTVKQLKDHYANYLKCQISRSQWTLEEDMKLVELINYYGRNWKMVENNLVGRTQNQIKNRYFGRIKKIFEKKKIQQDEIHFRKETDN